MPPDEVQRLTGQTPAMPDWSDLFEAWELIESDLHQQFSLDLDDIPDRDWRWLRSRIRGLLHDPSSRTHRATVKPRR